MPGRYPDCGWRAVPKWYNAARDGARQNPAAEARWCRVQTGRHDQPLGLVMAATTPRWNEVGDRHIAFTPGATVADGEARATSPAAPRSVRTIVSLIAAVVCVGWTQGALAELNPRAPQAKALARLNAPGGTDLAFSADGRFLLTAGADQARVWDARAYKPVTEALTHGGDQELVLACFSPDGAKVLTAAGAEVRVWDARTGRRIATRGHTAQVSAAAFSPDGSLVASGGDDKVTLVWQAATGKLTGVRQHHAQVRFVEFSPDGRRLLAIAAGRVGEGGDATRDADASALAYLWLTDAGEDVIEPWPVEHLTKDLEGGPGVTPAAARRRWRRAAAFSPDGKRLATIENWAVGLLDPAQPERKRWRWLETSSVRALAFSPDGARVVTAGPEVGVWEVASGKRVSDLEWTRQTREALFSEDGRRVLLAGHSWEGRWNNWRRPVQEFRDDGDGTGVWDTATGKQIVGVRVRPRNARANPPMIAYSPDGRRIAVGETDGREIIVFEAVPGRAAE